MAARVALRRLPAERDRVGDRRRALGQVPLAEPRVVAELDDQIRNLVELGPLVQVLAPMHGRDDALAVDPAELEQAVAELVPHALVLLSRLHDAVALAAGDVQRDVV